MTEHIHKGLLEIQNVTGEVRARCLECGEVILLNREQLRAIIFGEDEDEVSSL